MSEVFPGHLICNILHPVMITECFIYINMIPLTKHKNLYSVLMILQLEFESYSLIRVESMCSQGRLGTAG